jgi:hypothetical protein
MAKNELTRAEIAAMMAEAGLGFWEIVDADSYAAFADLLLEETAAVAAALSESLYAEYASAISGPASETALAKARDLANKNAALQAKNLTQAELNKIGSVIADGLEEGKGVADIARRLEAVKGLDGPRAKRYLKIVEQLEESDLTDEQLAEAQERAYQKLLRERREMIAHTEMADATGEARMGEAKQRGAAMKVSVTTGESNVCDSCLMNEAAGAIPIGETFPSGHDREPFHPGCRCAVAYFTNEKAADLASGRAEKRAEATAAAMAEAEGLSVDDIKQRAQHTVEITRKRTEKEKGD